MVGVINRSDKENIMSKRFYPKARRVNVLVTTSEMKQENFMGEWKLKMLNLTGFIPADISTEFVGGSNGDNRITFAVCSIASSRSVKPDAKTRVINRSPIRRTS
jgi:hypothetical protein